MLRNWCRRLFSAAIHSGSWPADQRGCVFQPLPSQTNHLVFQHHQILWFASGLIITWHFPVLNSRLVEDPPTPSPADTGKRDNAHRERWEPRTRHVSATPRRSPGEFCFEMGNIIQAPSEFHQDFSVSDILEQRFLLELNPPRNARRLCFASVAPLVPFVELYWTVVPQSWIPAHSWFHTLFKTFHYIFCRLRNPSLTILPMKPPVAPSSPAALPYLVLPKPSQGGCPRTARIQTHPGFYPRCNHSLTCALHSSPHKF